MMGESMASPKRWPLVNSVNSRDGLFTKDARLINAYAEKDVTTNTYRVTKRPGIGPVIYNLNVPDQGFGGGMFSWQVFKIGGNFPIGLVYNISWVAGGILRNFSQVSGLTTTIGALSVLGKVYFSQVPNETTPRIFMCGASATNTSAMYYMGLDLVLHQVGSAGNTVFNTVPGVAYLDGTLYVMDIFGNIWNSLNLDDPTVWDPLGFIDATAEADYGVVLGKQLTYIVAVKQWTTLFFYDAGNPVGSPLAPVPGALFDIGCLSADTFQQIDDTLIWVTRSKNQPSQVIMVHNLQPTIISTPAVERMLDLSFSDTFYSMVFSRSGHRFYLITNVTKNVTMVYDMVEKLWAMWTDPNGNCYPMSNQIVDSTGRWLQQRGDTGIVLQCDSDYIYPTDQNVVFPVDIYTPNFDAGIDRIKYLSQMRFNSDQVKGSTLFVRSSDNDFTTYSNFRKVDLGRVRPILNEEGSFYRRSYHFRHAAATPLRIDSVDLQMDIGTL